MIIPAAFAAAVVAAAAAAAGAAATTSSRLVDPRRQQMPLGVLPVAVLRLEGVLAVVAGVAAAVVAAVVARVVGRVIASSRRRSAVLVVLARRILDLRQLARPRWRTCRRTHVLRRRRRVILVQNTVEAHRAVAARDVVHHGEDGAGGGSLLRARDSGPAARRARSLVLRHRGHVPVIVAVASAVAIRRSAVGGCCDTRFTQLIVGRSGGTILDLFTSLSLAFRRPVAGAMHGRVRSRHGGRSRRDRARPRRSLRHGTRRAARHGERGERGRGRSHERQGGHGGHDLRRSRSGAQSRPFMVRRDRRGLRRLRHLPSAANIYIILY